MCWTITEPCLNPEFPQEHLKNYHARKIFVFLRDPMTWKVHAKKCVECGTDNLSDEEFAQALVVLNSAISQYLGHLKAMNDQVSSRERTLPEDKEIQRNHQECA